MRRTATYLASLMLIGAVLLTMQTALAEHESATLTRDIVPDESLECGDQITVNIAIDWNPEPEGSSTGLSIEEFYPSTWSVDSTTGGGGTSIDGRITWFIMDPDRESVSYTLTIAGDADGSFSFSGEYRDPSLESGDSNKQIVGDNSVSVTCDDPQQDPPEGDDPQEPGEGETNVDRSLSTEMDCGSSFQVLLALNWGDLSGRPTPGIFIEENVPEGWTATAPSEQGQISNGGRTVKWFIQDTSVVEVEYFVEVPDDAEDGGSFDFLGEFRDDTMGQDEPNQIIGGDQSTTVNCPDDVPADVTRSLPATAECGDTEVEVTLTITWNDAQMITVTETVPSGFIVNNPGGGTEGPAGTLVWEDLTPGGNPTTDLTYSVDIDSEAEGTFSFSGNFEDDTSAGQQTTGGDVDLLVDCPEEGSASRALPPVCRGPFTVSISVTPTPGAESWFVEEVVPENLTVDEGSISDGGTFNASQGKIKWVNPENGAATLTYVLVIADNETEGTVFDFVGSYRDDLLDNRVDLEGDTQVVTSCTDIHAFDQDENCVFDDGELFALIDAWKDEDPEAGDDVLFAGIALWRQSPDPYCED